MYTGGIDEREVAKLKAQLESIKVNYGSQGVSGERVFIEEMNQKFSGKKMDEFTDDVLKV